MELASKSRLHTQKLAQSCIASTSPRNHYEDWIKAKKYIDASTELETAGGSCKGRLEYVHANAADQGQMFSVAEDLDIAHKEGRIDICVACAGILRGDDCLTYSAEEFQKVRFLLSSAE